MSHSTPTTVNNYILELPDDYDDEKFLDLIEHVPADYLLQGVIHWVFTDQQEPLNDLLEMAMEQPIIDGTANITERVENLMHEVVPELYAIFKIQLESLVPKDFSHPRYISEVHYDEETGAILLVLDPDAESTEEDEAAKAATALISEENESEEGEGEAEGDEDDDEDAPSDDTE